MHEMQTDSQKRGQPIISSSKKVVAVEATEPSDVVALGTCCLYLLPCPPGTALKGRLSKTVVFDLLRTTAWDYRKKIFSHGLVGLHMCTLLQGWSELCMCSPAADPCVPSSLWGQES